MHAAFIVNAGAHGVRARPVFAGPSEIAAAASAHGIDASVELCEPGDVHAAADRARWRADAIVAAGGDGTVSSVAAALVGTDIPLGVLPLGTMNHFSRDLGIDGLTAALETIAAGRTMRVDVGEVNGRCFVNNSSIGLYPELVASRDAERHRTGTRQWLEAARTVLHYLLTRRQLDVTVALPSRVFATRTPFVLVGNNRYARDLLALGTRDRLDTGKLSIYTVHATSHLRLLRMLLHALAGARTPPELDEQDVERALIMTRAHSLKVAIDGEVVRMTPPLDYRIRPAALAVLAPMAETRRLESRTHEENRARLGPALREAPASDRSSAPR